MNCFVVSLVFLLSACATIYKTDSTQLKVIPASEMISKPEKYQEIVKQYLSEGKKFVIFIKAGQAVLSE